MCWAWAGAAMQGGSMIMGGAQSEQQKAAQIEQNRQNSWQAVKELNYKDANLKLQERDLLDSASQDLTAANLQRVNNMGMVRAAIGESGLEGNSMKRISRVTEGEMIRAANGVTENYKKDYAAIFAERLGARESTISQIEKVQENEPRLKGRLETIVDPLGIGMNKLVDIFSVGGAFERKLGRNASKKITASSGKSSGQSKMR